MLPSFVASTGGGWLALISCVGSWNVAIVTRPADVAEDRLDGERRADSHALAERAGDLEVDLDAREGDADDLDRHPAAERGEERAPAGVQRATGRLERLDEVDRRLAQRAVVEQLVLDVVAARAAEEVVTPPGARSTTRAP